MLTSRDFADGPAPAAIATYCLPFTSKVIGGAWKPEPALNFHSSSRVVSSYAAMVPSSSALKTRPPPVESAPLDLMRLAGKSVYRRMIPAACGVVVVGVVIYLLVR